MRELFIILLGYMVNAYSYTYLKKDLEKLPPMDRWPGQMFYFLLAFVPYLLVVPNVIIRIKDKVMK